MSEFGFVVVTVRGDLGCIWGLRVSAFWVGVVYLSRVAILAGEVWFVGLIF